MPGMKMRKAGKVLAGISEKGKEGHEVAFVPP